MRKLSSLFLVLLVAGCGNPSSKKSKKLDLEVSGPASVILLGAEITPELIQQSRMKGITVEGNTIIRLQGQAEDIRNLDIPYSTELSYAYDTPLHIERDIHTMPEAEALYLAKKEFGIPEFWKKYPAADGRGVRVGVIDDGISPHQVGFQKTTTGERKFLAKNSQSSLNTYSLREENGTYVADIEERTSFSGEVDLNHDGKNDPWKATVSLDGSQVCLDLNNDGQFVQEECGSSFSQTGQYFLLPSNRTLALMAEVNLEKKELKIFQAEKGSDSHGEGVASVLAGYRIGNIPGFDGVAPGAQIVDYDLSEYTNKPEENEYTLGTFLLAIDWLASQGVEVANVSYSLFFTSVESQSFMARALDSIVKKHNMVISFSAGNNGPGLGSLNRRQMYPSSVLVAGAYVPKDLDERVHGVTGLPEEGRVIYYSSRGPGAGHAGPLLISPLSSLVHSSPDGGMRAFSGTSSASPALAGAATVLISAIKQEGLKLDAPTVVNALRLSGKRLKAEPFVSQGYGLPQVEKALEIYKELIKGEKFMSIDATVNRGSLDGVAAQGIFIKTSSSSDVETYRISLTGVLSTLAGSDATVNLVTPIKIKYGKGVSGPRENWISSSASRIFVDVDAAEVLNGNNEGFSEIQILSQADNSLLAVIPVTVVDDLNIRKSPKHTLKVSSQEGARMHLHAAPGTLGYKVRARIIEGEKSVLNFATYDTNYIRTKQIAYNPEFFVDTPVSGHYQLTVLMAGGTKRKAVVEFEVEEVRMRLLTTDAPSKSGQIRILNESSLHLSGNLLFEKKGRTVKSLIFSNKESPELQLTLPKGEYTVSLSTTANYDMSYFYTQCHIQELGADGSSKPVSGRSYKATGEGEVTLKFRCVPFDRFESSGEETRWKMTVSEKGESKYLKAYLTSGARSRVNLPELTPGLYQVYFMNDSTSDAYLPLGNLNIE